jgi:excisionase family DNA binding protein
LLLTLSHDTLSPYNVSRTFVVVNGREGKTVSERLLVPVSEAHWLVGLGRSKFYEYVAAGEIEIIKIGRRTLVPQESLRAFVERLRGAEGPNSTAATAPRGVRGLVTNATDIGVTLPSTVP